MSEHDTGGPAFPTDCAHQTGYSTYHYEGMTLRDYFAAKALPIVATGSHCVGQDFLHTDHYESAALDAYRMADAMLKARSA